MSAPEAAVATPGTVPGVRVADVKVGERARKEYGDLEPLKSSIREHGLLQPIVLLPDNYLLCGGRRLEACKQLGWESIPFVRSTTQGDAISRLKAERDENTCRKDMTPSEMVAIGKKLAELKRPEAISRQGTRTDLATSGSFDPEVRTDDGHVTRNEVAEAVGMTPNTYKRAKRVVDAADDETADETVRAAAVKARTEMDAGRISVSRADAEVREAILASSETQQRRPEAERVEQIRPLAASGYTSGQIGREIGVGEDQVRSIARRNGVEISADRVMRGQRRGVDSNKIVQETINALEGLMVGIRLINYGDVAPVDDDRIVSLSDSITALTRLKKQLDSRR